VGTLKLRDRLLGWIGRDRSPARAAAARPLGAHPYHAVAVMPGVSACAAAKAIKGVRFLSREAPRLPLPDCPCAAVCRCRFAKYPDRRHHERRDIGSSHRWYPGADRRRSPGRRSTDL
jgi:hypothetical protein